MGKERTDFDGYLESWDCDSEDCCDDDCGCGGCCHDKEDSEKKD